MSERAMATALPQLNRDPDESQLPRFDHRLALALASAKFLLHAVTSFWHYGYFRDELYYLDAGRHLAFGYVDMAPLVAVYARIALFLGGSLPALRFLPALAGAA